jgi:hypothetical protein
VLVRNTKELDLLWISEPLLSTVKMVPTLEQIGPARPLIFDVDGTLVAPKLE